MCHIFLVFFKQKRGVKKNRDIEFLPAYDLIIYYFSDKNELKIKTTQPNRKISAQSLVLLLL